MGAFTQGQELQVYYSSPISLVYFEEVSKKVEISHWGNIWIHENYAVKHEGAQLQREFSRADFSPSAPQNGLWALRTLSTSLPLRTNGLYYGDIIGNISSSNAIREHNRVDLHLTPRYPIFGG